MVPTQFWLWQSVSTPAEQEPPFGFAAHWPEVQVPELQSVPFAQTPPTFVFWQVPPTPEQLFEVQPAFTLHAPPGRCALSHTPWLSSLPAEKTQLSLAQSLLT